MRRRSGAGKFSSELGQVIRRRSQGEDWGIYHPRKNRKEANIERKKMESQDDQEVERPRSCSLLGLTWAWIRNLFSPSNSD